MGITMGNYLKVTPYATALIPPPVSTQDGFIRFVMRLHGVPMVSTHADEQVSITLPHQPEVGVNSVSSVQGPATTTPAHHHPHGFNEDTMTLPQNYPQNLKDNPSHNNKNTCHVAIQSHR